MSKVVLYIAMSLDGYIARWDDDVSWLDAYQASGEDYGYGKFMSTVGTAVMGARTYLESLKHPDRLLPNLKTYVLSHHPLLLAQEGETEIFSGGAAALLEKIRQKSEADIYLVGGGVTLAGFLELGLIDEMLIFVVPILLGGGLLLFAGLKKETSLVLIEITPYPTGLVKLHYRKNEIKHE